MKSQMKVSFGLVAAFVLAVGALLLGGKIGGDTTDAGMGDGALIPPDSHGLGARGARSVESVEFLDFECEDCAAAFPIGEQLRTTYAGRVALMARDLTDGVRDVSLAPPGRSA